MKTYMEVFENVLQFMKKHKTMTSIMCGVILGLHIVANVVYFGKPVPITHIVLQPWMAFINVFIVGIATGGVSTYAQMS